MSAGAAPSDVVFVGGTGRSGTHVLGRLLGEHERYADVPIEARFHCNKRGFADLLGGRVSLAGFLEKLRDFWWHRVRVDGQPRGLYNLTTRARLDAAADRFAAAYHANPLDSCRALFRELLWGVADQEGKAALVEMSSHNVREAQTLRRLFAGARFIHAVRDGRDAASSVATKTWGPDRILAGIDWWAARLRAIEAGLRGEEDGLPFRLPPDRLHTVVLDELAGARREDANSELLDFLGIGESPQMRTFLEREMGPDSAHLGRWRNGLGPVGRARVRRRYERTLAALDREGNHVAGPLIAAYDRGG